MEISVGAILEGTIKSITKFGAFVTLPGGRSGLVHISEIAHSYVENVSDFLSEGQTVKVKVVNIDEAGRINLSIKKATPPLPVPRASAGTGRTAPPTSGAVTAAALPPRVAAATTTAAGSPPATVPAAATTATTPAPLPPSP